MLKKFFTSICLALFFVSIIFTNCNNTTKTTPSTQDTIPKNTTEGIGIKGSFSNQTKITFDSTIIKAFLDSFPKFKTFEKDIITFYNGRNYAYAWYDDNGMIEPATNLYNLIQNISDEGVPDVVPYKPELTNLMATEEGSDAISSTTELMLTSQYLAYAKNVWQGISEKQVLSIDWFLPRKKITSQQLLDSLVSGNNILDNSPVFRQYNLLKEYLKKYNDIKAKGELETIKADKKTYQQGDSSAVISAIRKRLFLLGDLPANNESGIFDTTLENGVKSFERRLGLRKME